MIPDVETLHVCLRSPGCKEAEIFCGREKTEEEQERQKTKKRRKKKALERKRHATSLR